MPFSAAVQTTPDGQPQFMCLRQQPFTSEEVAVFAARSIAPSATVVSDGLWCFGALQIVGATHERVVTGGGKASTELPQLRAVNTVLGNLKRALGGTQLLSEMDGFDASVGLMILAATNRPEILDPALLRAGRFDRQVLVDRADKKGRIDILAVHVRKVKLDPAVKLDEVAALTPGFSGADLANLVNEATLVATRRKADSTTLADFTAAVERIVGGLERKNRVLNPKEREAVAFHEMGHALVALAQEGSDPVHKVSIIPRGIGALGYTIQRPTEDRYLMTRAELEQKIAVLMGGRAAEKLVFGQLSTGASDDLAKATDIARAMVTRYGMDEGLGYIAFEAPRQTMLDLPTGMLPNASPVSEDTQRRIDDAIRAIVMGGFDRATAILGVNRDVLERSARALLDKETLDEAAIRCLTADLRSE